MKGKADPRNMPLTQRPEKPNLVFILPDRLRQDTSAAYGNGWIQSPHMDSLASESYVFEHCYERSRFVLLRGLLSSPVSIRQQRGCLATDWSCHRMFKPSLKRCRTTTRPGMWASGTGEMRFFNNAVLMNGSAQITTGGLSAPIQKLNRSFRIITTH